MEIKIIDGFQVIDSEKGILLRIESDKLEQYIEYAIEKKITRIAIDSHSGYTLKNVDFLKKTNFFTGITIPDESIEISGIYNSIGLKYLSLANGKQGVDLTKFPLLEECSIDWNNKIIGLDYNVSIKRLSIWKFKPKLKDFTVLKGCKDVEYFHFTESNIESFKGIEVFKSLIQLEGYYLPKLISLDFLNLISSQLKVLILDNCKNLKKHETILTNMEHLEKLILGDCGELESINFINSLDRLRFFSFVNTNVLDGNLTPILRLEYAGFSNKKHFSHKMISVGNKYMIAEK